MPAQPVAQHHLELSYRFLAAAVAEVMLDPQALRVVGAVRLEVKLPAVLAVGVYSGSVGIRSQEVPPRQVAGTVLVEAEEVPRERQAPAKPAAPAPRVSYRGVVKILSILGLT